MISGLPRYSRIAPETHTPFPYNVVSGVPNFVRSLPQMTAVKT
jgi:hypothetical protein